MVVLEVQLKVIHSFIHFWHAPLWVALSWLQCVAPNVDIILQSGRFWAMSIASFRERFNDSRSCWIVDSLHPCSMGRFGGLLQFSKDEAVKICLASDSSGIHTVWPNRERHRAWTVAQRCDCSVFRFTSSFRTWWYHLNPNSLQLKMKWINLLTLCLNTLWKFMMSVMTNVIFLAD